ncbi:STAS-like domain-containing protein [Candidatus Saccharibacteria bacterium]|nr:STAS-like domain-containing protein [Candidatus Saccharibacteria bacterium]
METIKMLELAGEFAENKDIAKEIRTKQLLPALKNNRAVTFDFGNVKGATQSFIHALISDALRKYPDVVYDNVFYKNASEEIQKIITIVYRYMQESL